MCLIQLVRDQPIRFYARNLLGKKLPSWYPSDIEREDPVVVQRKEQERLSKLEMLKRRGKGPPKKGQGKRATKRNK